MSQRQYFQRVPESGLVIASTTAQLVTLTDPRWPKITFYNQDMTDLIIVKIGASASVVATQAGTNADYSQQLVIRPGETRPMRLENIQFFSVICRANNPQLEWWTEVD